MPAHTHIEAGDEATYGAVPTLLDDGTPYTPYQPPPKSLCDRVTACCRFALVLCCVPCGARIA